MTSLLHTKLVLNRITDIIQPFQDYAWVHIFLAAGALRFWCPFGFQLKKCPLIGALGQRGSLRRDLLEETSRKETSQVDSIIIYNHL